MDPSTASRKPNISEDFAVDLVFRLYSFKIISIKRMVSFFDQNFHIQVSNDHQNPYVDSVSTTGYTLKINNIARSAVPDHFDSMTAAMIHLHNKGLRVPLPVRNVEGMSWKLEKVPLLNNGSFGDFGENDKCGIRLLTFLPGQPVSAVTSTPSILHQWGTLLARFHNATEDFDFPYLKTKSLFWDLDHVLEIKSFMGVLDAEKTKLVQSVLNEYAEQMEKKFPNLRKGFIHGDFNENNILCQVSEKSTINEKEYVVDGILDFDDVHYGTYAWDIGVMLAYTLLDCNSMDPLVGAGHALAGYLKYRSLDKLELNSLKICIACRLCQSLVLGAYCYSLEPSNSYLIISARSGWQRLRQIWGTKNEDLLQLWKNIQNSYNFC